MKYHKIDSVCTYCGVGCEISAFLENGNIVKIEPNEHGISNFRRLCIKGKTGYEFLYSENKLKKHLIKKDFVEKNRNLFKEFTNLLIDEDEKYFSADLKTVSKIAALKLEELSSKYGRHSLGFVGGARTSCESAWLFQRFAREINSSPNIDNCARVCHSPSLAGLKKTVGEGAATNPFDDILKAEFLLVIGSNTTEAHPIVASRIMEAAKKGTTVAVADIREIQLSKKANFHLTLPPECNLLFLNVMARVIIEEKMYDKHFINHRVSGFDEFKKAILADKMSSPDIFLKMKGYEKLSSQVKEVARVYAKSKSMILWGLGITEHTDGSKATAAIANLALLTGNIGKIGAGLMPLRGQNNVQGACDVGCLPYYAPGYKKPKEEGLKTPQMVDAMLANEMKSLWIMGEDITHIHTNINKIEQAIKNLEFLVVQEVMNADVINHADIIFAVKSAYEKSGVFVNAERRLHLSRPLVNSDLPDDWEVLTEVANNLGANLEYKTSENVWDDVRADNYLYSGAPYSKLQNKPIQWPISESGAERLHEISFRTNDGLGHLYYEAYEPRGFALSLLKNEKPKLTLSTGRAISHYNNAAQTKQADKLTTHYSEDVVLINHESAKGLDLTKKYALKSIYGESGLLTFKEDKKVPSGVLFTTFHFKDSNINKLFGDEADETTLTPRFKAVEVEIVYS